MKKTKIIALACVFVLVVATLCGCSFGKEGKLKTETNRIMKGIQSYDETIIDEITDKSDTRDAIAELTEDSEGDSEESYDKTASVVEDYLKQNASQMKYEITDVDADKMKVTVKCTYVDTTDVMDEFVGEIITKALASIFTENEIDDADMEKAFQDAIDSVKEQKMITEDIVLTFEEGKKGYVLKDGYKELKKVASSKISEYDLGGDNNDNDEELAKNVEYNVIETTSGVALEVTNKNKETVGVSFDVIFNDENGAMLEDSSASIDALAPGQTQFVGAFITGNAYASAEVSMKAYSTSRTPVTDIAVEDNAVDNGVMVKITNNSKTDISSIEAFAIYYKDGNIIGFDNNYDSDLKQGGFSAVHINAPYDPQTYDSIAFDEYKVYVQAYE